MCGCVWGSVLLKSPRLDLWARCAVHAVPCLLLLYCRLLNMKVVPLYNGDAPEISHPFPFPLRVANPPVDFSHHISISSGKQLSCFPAHMTADVCLPPPSSIDPSVARCGGHFNLGQHGAASGRADAAAVGAACQPAPTRACA